LVQNASHIVEEFPSVSNEVRIKTLH
jgi:hypothetical protein